AEQSARGLRAFPASAVGEEVPQSRGGRRERIHPLASGSSTPRGLETPEAQDLFSLPTSASSAPLRSSPNEETRRISHNLRRLRERTKGDPRKGPRRVRRCLEIEKAPESS